MDIQLYIDKAKNVPYDKNNLRAYREAQEKVNNELKGMLESYHNVSDNPKRDALWRLAWDYGHAYGYNEIASFYGELVTLIQ